MREVLFKRFNVVMGPGQAMKRNLPIVISAASKGEDQVEEESMAMYRRRSKIIFFSMLTFLYLKTHV
jgi:hypothetical protein